jgi:dUTP pyrophosphatase
MNCCCEKEVKIDIKYHSNEIEKLRYIEGKSDWIDLRSAKRYELKAGEFSLIDLGISIRLPDGYEAHIAPRSSTFKHWGLIQTNSVGIVDNSYSGNNDIWLMPVYATRDTVIEINDRVCQFRIMKKQPIITFNETDQLDENNRGGFGSTGKQ